MEMPIPLFLSAWYTGTFITAVLMHLFYRDQGDKNAGTAPITMRGLLIIFMLSVSILLSMALTIVTYRAPQVIIQPIFLVSEMILPALIGLYLFHERKNFDTWQWIFFAIGTVGALIVGFSFGD